MRSLYRFVVVVAISICFCIVWAYPQSRTNASGTGGIHTIQGRIFLPSGRSPSGSIIVELQSTSYSTLTVNTDQNGSFGFRGLAPGSYTVVVNAGDDFDIAREYITIDDEVRIDPTIRLPSTPKVITLPVYLQSRRTSTLGRAEVINAKMVDVPKEALKHYDKGLEFFRLGKTDNALVEFKQAVSIYPKFTEAFVEIGKVNIKLAKFDNAVEAFRSAVNLDQKNFEAKLGYGISLLEKKELNNAETQLKDSININSKSVFSHYYLALVLINKKNFDNAQREFELTKQLKEDNTLPLVHYYLGGIYWSKKQYKKSADELEKYLKISPDANDSARIRQTITDLRSKEN